MSQSIILTETTLTKLGFSRIDKLCDAKFIKKIFKETKKDFSLFVNQNDDIKDFFDTLESKMDEQNEEMREMIQEYVESISDDINKFRTQLKELKRQKKNKEKELEKQQIIDEYLRQQEAKEKLQEIKEKMGLKSSSESRPNETKKKDTGLTFKKALASQPPDEKLIQVEEEVPKQSSEKEEEYQVSLNIEEFFEFLKVVVKEDILVIKNDQGRMKIKDLDLDEGKIRVKVE